MPAIQEAPPDIQVSHAAGGPQTSGRAVEHFEISDGVESELDQKNTGTPVPTCEEMFDGLDAGIAKPQDSELLAAAVGLATAAVATAAVTASAPVARPQEQPPVVAMHRQEVAQEEEEEQDEEVGEEDEEEEEYEEEEEEEEEDAEVIGHPSSAHQQGLQDLGVEDDEEVNGVDAQPQSQGGAANACADLAELGILDSVDDAEVEFQDRGRTLSKIEDELEDEVF